MAEKDKTVAGILGILLGLFGAHKFYLGKHGQGVLYVLFFWTYIPAIIGLIEGIRYLVMDEKDFQRQYGTGGPPPGRRARRRRICVTCGIEIDPDYNACPHCGTIVKKTPEQRPPAPPSTEPDSGPQPQGPDAETGAREPPGEPEASRKPGAPAGGEEIQATGETDESGGSDETEQTER